MIRYQKSRECSPGSFYLKIHITQQVLPPVSRITKATGMEKVLSAVGIDRAHSIAIGDSGNDRAMLEYAGIGIATENSEKALLKAADDITASNLDCGVANAIEKYLL